MICKNCGKEIVEGDRFCSGCGAEISSQVSGIEEGTTDNVVSPIIPDMGMGEKIRQKRKFNLSYLGIFLSGIVMMVSPFLDNSVTGRTIRSVVDEINNRGYVSGYTLAFIVIICVAFTLLMAYFKKHIITVIGSVLSLGCAWYTLTYTGASLLNGIGYILLLASGLLLLISSVASVIFEKKQRLELN